MKVKLWALAALLCALPCAARANGFFVSVGAAGGLVFGSGGKIFMSMSGPAHMTVGGLRFSGGYGMTVGPGTLELGAATGFSYSGIAAFVPLVLTAGYSVPMGESLAFTSGFRAGAAAVSRNGGITQFEPIIGPWMELEIRDRGQTWGFHIGVGADFFLEEIGIGGMFTAGLGFKYLIG